MKNKDFLPFTHHLSFRIHHFFLRGESLFALLGIWHQREGPFKHKKSQRETPHGCAPAFIAIKLADR